MNRIARFCTCVLLLAGTYAVAADEAPFVLEVGTNEYPVKPGETVEIETPGGERVRVKLVNKTRYNKHGIAFNYPAAFSLSEEIQFKIPTIIMQSKQSAVAMMQIFPQNAKKTSEIHNLLVKGIQAQFMTRGARFSAGSGTPIKQEIAGEDRDGTQLIFELAGQTVYTRIFTFSLGDRVISLMLQNDQDEGRAAARLFGPILQSLQTVDTPAPAPASDDA